MHESNQYTVPLWALLAEQRRNRYGSIPGLPDEEPADPAELERQVYLDELGPLLGLPSRGRQQAIRPVADESGHVVWGAFGTVDFDRNASGFDKRQFRLERVRDELEHVLIMLGMIRRRLPGKAKYLVLKYLRMGIIETDMIVSTDMLEMARLHERARRLRREIARLNVSGPAMPRQREAWLMS